MSTCLLSTKCILAKAEGYCENRKRRANKDVFITDVRNDVCLPLNNTQVFFYRQIIRARISNKSFLDI